MTDRLQAGVAVAPLPEPAESFRPARGKLRIFFGMAAGVGKTRAMLYAAYKQRLAGHDVVIACLEDPALSREISAKGLNVLRWERHPTGHTLPTSLEVEAVLARRPDIAVVDGLACQNAPGSRHPERYQDVADLLGAGIDVFTTLSVGQVASRVEEACRITGLPPGPVVPDALLDAAELELVDVAPQELLKRLSRGELRFAPLADPRSHALEEGRLMALRELAVRLFAERVAKDARAHLARSPATGPLPAGRRLLAVIRPEHDSEPVVRWARQAAESFHAEWSVLYVEGTRPLSPYRQSRITGGLALARELGADVLITADEDPVVATLRVAAQHNVTDIILGKAPEPWVRPLLYAESFASQLLHRCADLPVHLVPLTSSGGEAGVGRRDGPKQGRPAQYGLVVAVIAAVTLAACLLTPLVGPHATALIFLLTVVLLALFVERGPILAAAALSALLWDYFILPPVFAFQITHFEDAMLLGMYFIVALVLGNLTTRIRAQQAGERERESRATTLYLLTRGLNESVSLNEMVQRIVQQLHACFDAEVAVLLPQADNTLKAHPGGTFTPPAEEQRIPGWVWQQRQRAGKLTNHFPSATALYLPLLTSGGPVGVLVLRLTQTVNLSLHRENLVDAISQQIAMALDRHRLNGIYEQAKLLAESERLSKTLLDSISHEIRTPIAAIKGATGNLADLQDTDTQVRQEMIGEIQEATDRLNRLVGNMLEAGRLESGAVKPRLNECDARELVHVVLEDTAKELSGHRVTLKLGPELPVVPMDFVLTQQALVNLLSNAAQHTPPGTEIEVGARVEPNSLVLTVADRGAGIPPECLPRVFDKFYRVPNSRTGGTGLGLSLVRGFVEAQRGRVTAANRAEGGAVFTIYLPRAHASLQPSETAL